MPPNLFNSSPTVKTSPSMQPTVALPDNSGQKRAALDIEKQTTPQEFKRPRASYACLSCRARKVRCNVAEGSPCLNCRLDQLQCLVKEHRSRKWKKKSAASKSTDRSKEPISPRENDLSPCELGTIGRYRAGSPMIKEDSVPAPPTTYANNTYLTDIGIDDAVPSLSYQWPDHPCAQYSNQNENGAIKKFLRALEIQHTIARLPPFLRPLPDNMEPDAIRYLHRMKALDLPTVSLQNALLRAYVECIHPSMPLMGLHNFLNTVYYRHGRNGQVSLLLYHSVMFATTAFVNMKALCQAGYKTRKEAREKFFQKARLLYDFDYEHDGLVLVQSLLLMTYWDESPGDLKGTWYWINIAVSYCYRIELHRQSRCGVANTHVFEQRLRRRVWWCYYMRDRIIALGMRRPPIIEDDTFDVPMLVESDFEIEELAYSNTIEQLELTLLQDVKMQQELATLCIETAKLCIPVGQILRARYSIRSMSQPRNDQGIYMLRSKLQTWAASLTHALQVHQSTVLDARDGRSTMMVQRTMLHMLHQTAIWVLHHSQYSLPSGSRGLSSTSGCHETNSISWRIARDAASQVSQMIIDLHHLQLDKFLTSSAITLMTPAIIFHLAEMGAGVTPARELKQCLLVIEQLRDVYTVADQVASFIEAILTRPTSGINLSCEQDIISILKNELSAAVIAQKADSKNSQPAENILVDAFNASTPELLTAPHLPDESPFTEQITMPGDNLSGSLGGCIDITDLNCINGLVDFDWKTTEETELGGGFWLDENECK